ncbi:MAG: ubiquinol-cytochrome c reductase iron-sulfur subunit [Acidimicrobiia bacterium]
MGRILMEASQILLIGVAAVAVLGAVAVFAIAYRREGGTKPWRSRVERKAVREDKSAPPEPVVTVAPEAEETIEIAVEVREEPPAAVTTAIAVREVTYEEVPADEMGVTRRQFFNRALLATFGAYSVGLLIAMVGFLWPRLRGGFGGDIDAGDVQALRTSVFNQDGSIQPLFIPEARAYVVPFPTSEIATSQFDPPKIQGKTVVAEGLSALFQTCVHLGCRVPWCSTSQGFECPCHGSRYNSTGEYEGGPAPRNLDRFEVEVNASNRFIIRTGSRVGTSRAPSKSVPYPLGRSCITIGLGEGEDGGERG